MSKPNTQETIAVVVLGVILVIMIIQGDRIWDMIERLVRVETIVEIYRE